MKRAVICFTRVPKPGKTKTRLLPVLSGEQCAALHRAFLMDLAAVYEGISASVFVAYTPESGWETLKEIFPRASGFFPQQGADLGERMYHAVSHVLAMGYGQVVLTGSDLPAMSVRHLESGFAGLETADVVLGPTSDGGYYLIGMKQPQNAVFHVPGYGGATVYESTLLAANRAGLSVCPVMCCDDCDTPEDLTALAKTADPESATGRCLTWLKQEGISL